MDRFFLMCALCCMALGGLAQDGRVRWTDEVRLDRDDRAVSLMQATDSTFTFRHDRSSTDSPFMVLEHFHAPSLTPTWTRPVELPEGLPSGARFIDMYPVGPFWVAAFDHTDRKEKRHSMHVAALNPDGIWLGPAREAHVRTYDKYENRTYEVFTSADSTRLVGHLAGPFGKEELAEHALVVLGADLEPLYTRELVLPYSDDQLRVRDVLLDTQGNIHLYAAQPRPKVRLDSQRAVEERKNHTLFSYYWQSNTLKELEIDLQTQWITDARVAFTPGGAIGVAGLYSNGPYFRTKGIFGLVLEPTSRRILSQGLVRLPKETIDGFSSRRRSDGGREIANLYLDHALFPTDTTWTLVAEQFEVVERVSTDPATGRQIITYSYRYEDILVATGGANNALLRTTQVRKSQAITVDPEWYSSYTCVPRQGGITLLFNDHPDNGTLDGDARSLVGLREVSIRRVDVARSGAQNRTEVDFMGADGANFRPELFLELGPRGVVLFGQYKRTYRLGVLDF